jgi:hypothetical protein
MADAFNLSQLGNLPPELYEQQQNLNRQQQMAQMLIQQGQQQPQGQMISGRYVAPSIFQNLAGLAQTGVGAYLQNKGDKQALELAEKLRGTRMSEIEAINQAIANKDWNKAQQLINYSETGVGKEMLPRLMERNIPDVQKPQVVSKGGSLVGPDGKVIFQSPYGGGEGEDGMGAGRFNKKGDWVAPGVFIQKQDVSKDREIVRAANELRQNLQEITPQDIKASESIFGSVNEGGPISYLAKQFKNPAVAAQAKINTSAVMQTLENLPPGAASDADIKQAKSSFPGYGDAIALQKWVNNTDTMLRRKIDNANSKYGTDSWYGVTGINTKDKAPALNAKDQEALAWANANPSDPRSTQIKKRLGAK